ncbi:MAG: hypothetical protein LH614_16880 [Pyrinomonadaceae bacterium]|nr:hypothetical protein [Pyrinomonadaceae bacterium]
MFLDLSPSSFRVQTSVCIFRRASLAEEHAQAWTLNEEPIFETASG